MSEKELKRLKELKPEFVAFEGKLELSDLIDKKIQEEAKKQFGQELMIPLIVFAYAKNKLIAILYRNEEDYKEGKAILFGDTPESIKDFYEKLTKIISIVKE